MTKPNFMANPVKTADTVNSKLAGDDSNDKRSTKNLKKNLEQKATITPKKRPARGRLLCLFPHRTAMVGTMLFFQRPKHPRSIKSYRVELAYELSLAKHLHIYFLFH